MLNTDMCLIYFSTNNEKIQPWRDSEAKLKANKDPKQKAALEKLRDTAKAAVNEPINALKGDCCAWTYKKPIKASIVWRIGPQYLCGVKIGKYCNRPVNGVKALQRACCQGHNDCNGGGSGGFAFSEIL